MSASFQVRVHRMALVATLCAVVATPALAQDTQSPADKMDAVVASRAAEPLGRTRVLIRFKDRCDVRTITSRRGKAGRCSQIDRSQVAVVENSELASLADDQRVERVMVDRPVFATLARTRAAVGAALVQGRLDVTGRGIGIAIIDSGVEPGHDDLAFSNDPSRTTERIAHFKDFTRSDANPAVPSDEYGHGTHVSGIISGSGYDSDGARRGLAPGSDLVELKVLDANGNGYISDVIDAIDYAVATRKVFNIRVINLSVASGVFESYYDDPLALAAKRANDAGIVVVAAAGNLGTSEDGQLQFGGITSPGNAPWVIAVGASSHQGTAHRSDDVMASFSSRGPGAIDFMAKPDIAAPGVGIESLAAPGSTLATTLAAYTVGATTGAGNRPYLSLSGTSMAAPVVSGAIALMLEVNPDLTPNAVKAILMYTAQPMARESALAQGAGLLNVAGAVRMARFFGQPDRDPGPTVDVIEGEVIPWSRHINWGNYRITGGVPMPGSNAWSTTVTWGAMKGPRGLPIVWGKRTLDGVKATRGSQNIVWATGGRDNIVWATGGRDNIVWATRGQGNIVWATGARGNIVWATAGRGNIVWATRGHDNIVWATAIAENLVWGDECGGRNCTQAIWGIGDEDDQVHGARGSQNIVWATGGRDNIVWATAGRANIVWATAGRANIVWATAARDNIVWATSALRNILWPASSTDVDLH